MVLGVVSMLIVLIAGFSSGLVRFPILGLRSLFAFAMTSAAVYFIFMLYDYYRERQELKLKKDVAEVAGETPTESGAEDSPQSENAFQPINANDLPNVEK